VLLCPTNHLKQPKQMNDSKRDYSSVVLFLSIVFIIFLMSHSKREQYSMAKGQVEYAKFAEKK